MTKGNTRNRVYLASSFRKIGVHPSVKAESFGSKT